MTKDEIKALIAHGIEGQGSAIDLGGVLPKILNGLLDAIPEEKTPLYVEGVIVEAGGTDFTPYKDSPSWESAKEAFISGRPVFLKYVDDTYAERTTLINSSDPDNFNLYANGSTLITWFRDESPIDRDESPW